MKVFITGGSGLIGRHLVPKLFDRAERVICLTRSPERARSLLPPRTECVKGDPTRPGPWQATVGDCDAVINLAGEPIAAGRWTAARKQRLRRSRLRSTANVAEGIAASGGRRCTLISASATGYYGDGGDVALTEQRQPGHDFLARLCYEWERAALQAESGRCRVVVLRIGVVLARDGGALPRMLIPFRYGCGGPLGNGRQFLPWIDLNDLVRVILFALDSSALRGPVNTVAPDPPTQAEFARKLGAALGRPSLLPVPALALRLLLGELAEVVLSSQRAVPNVLKAAGFKFGHADLAGALADLLA